MAEIVQAGVRHFTEDILERVTQNDILENTRLKIDEVRNEFLQFLSDKIVEKTKEELLNRKNIDRWTEKYR